MLFNLETQNLICGLPVLARAGILPRDKSRATDLQRASQGKPWGAFFLGLQLEPTPTKGGQDKRVHKNPNHTIPTGTNGRLRHISATADVYGVAKPGKIRA
jgi:hypothetical protein